MSDATARTAVVIFEGDRVRDETRKSLPRYFLQTLHRHLESIVLRSPATELYTARLEAGVFEIRSESRVLLRRAAPTLDHQIEIAVAEIFAVGHSRVVLIGGDTLQLTETVLAEVVDSLTTDAPRGVIVPAADGGFCLVGLNRLPDIDWSELELFTSSAGARLERSLSDSGFLVESLSPLDDADSIEQARRGLDRRSRLGRTLLARIAEHCSDQAPLEADSPVSSVSSPSEIRLRAPPLS